MDVTSVTATEAHPRPTTVGAVRWRRITLACVGVAAVVAGIEALASVRPSGGVGVAVAIALGLLLAPLIASPLEWFVHRFVYHAGPISPLRPIFVIHTVHHYLYFPTWRYTTGGPARRLAIKGRAPEAHESPARNAGVRLAHFSWYMAIGLVAVWTPAWLVTHDWVFVLASVASTAVVSNLFIVVHDTIHRPGTHRIVETQPWFAFLDRHHYVHHVDLGTNLNFLLPLADWLFGTLRTELTADELARHGTMAAAKARPVGHGEAARLASSEPDVALAG